MHDALRTAGGVAVLAGLSVAGGIVAPWLGGVVPGPVLGLGAYLLLLASGRADWTLRGADLLTGLIGAMIVPALVGLALSTERLVPVLGPLALVLIVSTAVTAVTAALLFRALGGRL